MPRVKCIVQKNWRPSSRISNSLHSKLGKHRMYQHPNKISLSCVRKGNCFYCQTDKIWGGKTERLVTCRSNNVEMSMHDIVTSASNKAFCLTTSNLVCLTVETVEMSMHDIVDTSGNEQWRVNLANIFTGGDFLLRYIKYHKSCHITNWRKYEEAKERVCNREPPVEANIQWNLFLWTSSSVLNCRTL